MIQVPPDPYAPRKVDDLPRYWDDRRKYAGKSDSSLCAADLRQALIAERGLHLRGLPLIELVVMAAALFVALWSGVQIYAERPPQRLCPEPPICICPEPP